MVPRLASLYHHSYRCYGPEDPTPRKRSLRQLADLHYVKAANLFLTAERSLFTNTVTATSH